MRLKFEDALKIRRDYLQGVETIRKRAKAIGISENHYHRVLNGIGYGDGLKLDGLQPVIDATRRQRHANPEGNAINESRVLAALMARADDELLVRAGARTLAPEAGLTVNKVATAINRLMVRGVLVREEYGVYRLRNESEIERILEVGRG